MSESHQAGVSHVAGTKRKPVYIFVSGGVISSLGKGITSASIGLLLQSRGFRVSNLKCEMYVNIDAGTIRPTEHGEVFVTRDGMETDLDVGNYERFVGKDMTRASYITTGQVYQHIIQAERAFAYEGEDVEVVPHVPMEIIRRIRELGAAEDADFVIIEVGGTVGEYQNVLFLEADRMLCRQEKGRVLNVHVSYLPVPASVGEMKTKPVQMSVRMLNTAGIFPDIVIGRSPRALDEKRKAKISLHCNVDIDQVFSNPDVASIYEVPLVLEKQGLTDKILSLVGLADASSASGVVAKGARLQEDARMEEWRRLVDVIKTAQDEVRIGIIGKYLATGDYSLEDSYMSVAESVKHAAWKCGRKPRLVWFDAERFEQDPSALRELDELDGVIVPGGFGLRGVEGKIAAIQYVREHRIPFLGLCLGLQMAIVEVARHVAGLTGAHSTEMNAKTAHPVIAEMPEQKKLIAQKQMGGTMRLGSFACELAEGSVARGAYGGAASVSERHRHRYEFNNAYRAQLEAAGMIMSGVNPELGLVEIGELRQADHPYFVGCQFHPEFQSRPLDPHPLFVGLIEAGINKKS